MAEGLILFAEPLPFYRPLPSNSRAMGPGPGRLVVGTGKIAVGGWEEKASCQQSALLFYGRPLSILWYPLIYLRRGVYAE